MSDKEKIPAPYPWAPGFSVAKIGWQLVRSLHVRVLQCAIRCVLDATVVIVSDKPQEKCRFLLKST
jgi:hypothetical protein